MPAKRKNPLAFLNMRVSVRDRAIFDAVCIRNQSQAEVAKHYGLSQQRISKIVARVSMWLSQPDPAGLKELPRGDRLRMVSRRHLMRLESLRTRAEESFELSRQAKITVKRRWVKGELVMEERSVTNREGDRRLLRDEEAFEQRIVEFEGFDRYGNVDVSTKGRVYEVSKEYDDVIKREIKKSVMSGKLDTPGDEGIPGIWGGEMAMTNAKVKLQSGRSSSHTPCSTSAGDQQRAAAEGEWTAGAHEARYGVDEPNPELAGLVPAPVGDPAAFTEHGMFGDYGSDYSSPPDELLYEKDGDSSQEDVQQVVREKAIREKVLYGGPELSSAPRTNASSSGAINSAKALD